MKPHFRSLVILIMPLLFGCQTKTYSWQEEAKLSNGRAITTQRTVAFRYFQPIGGGGGADIPNSSIRIVHEVDAPALVWSQPPLIPILVDKDPATQEWFIVTTFIMCNVWYEIGRPKLPYVEFRYRAGKWIQVPLSSSAIGRDANLIMPDEPTAQRNHTVQSKEADARRKDPTAYFQHIVGKWKTSC